MQDVKNSLVSCKGTKNWALNVWNCVHLAPMTALMAVMAIHHAKFNAGVIKSNACITAHAKKDVRLDALAVNHHFVRIFNVLNQI